MWLFIDKKTFSRNNELLKLKNMDWLFDWNITKWKKYVNSHFKFVIEIQYVTYYEIINPNEELFFENLNHLIVKDFQMVKIGPYLHKTL
jgi:hypothetical protein